MFLLGGMSLDVTTILFCWRYSCYYVCQMFPVARADLDTMLKGLHKGVNIMRQGRMGANVEAVYNTITFVSL